MNRAIYWDVPQRSEAWRALRAGKLTASQAKAALAQTKTGSDTAMRRDLRAKLVTERITGCAEDTGHRTPAMVWGIDHEAEALRAYAQVSAQRLYQIGFVEHPDLAAGASPDALTEDGTVIVEVKCPMSHTHAATLRERTIPARHLPQLQHALLCCDRADRVEFVSYDPRFPSELRLFHATLTREEAGLEAYTAQVVKFLEECDVDEADLRALR